MITNKPTLRPLFVLQIALGIAVAGFLILVALPRERRFSEAGIQFSVTRFPYLLFLRFHEEGRRSILRDGKHLRPLPEKHINPSMELMRKCVRKYPAEFLKGKIRTVYLVRQISGLRGWAGEDEIVIAVGRRLEAGDTADIERTFHHEIAHVLHDQHRKEFDKRAWIASNPDDFAYGDDAEDGPRDYAETNDTMMSRGFVRRYSMHNIREDYADVAAQLFKNDDVFWIAVEKNDRLKKKVMLAIDFYHRMDSVFTKEYFRRIENEAPGLAMGVSDLVGEYFFGDGLGVNCSLALSGDKVFRFKWQGCMGTYDTNHGAYDVENGLLILLPKEPNVQEGYQGTPTRFLPVRWGDRLYLVPDDRILEFCNEFNQGMEPQRRARSERFYLRRGDEKKRVRGFPDLPLKWREYLLTKPVRGEVVAVIGDTLGVINVGTGSGLKAGMLMTAHDPQSNAFAQLDVIDIESETALVTTRYEGYKIRAGFQVSSRFREDD